MNSENKTFPQAPLAHTEKPILENQDFSQKEEAILAEIATQEKILADLEAKERTILEKIEKEKRYFAELLEAEAALQKQVEIPEEQKSFKSKKLGLTKKAVITAAAIATPLVIHEADPSFGIPKFEKNPSRNTRTYIPPKPNDKEAAAHPYPTEAKPQTIEKSAKKSVQEYIDSVAESDPTVAARAEKLLPNIDKDLFEKLSLSAKPLYLKAIEENIRRQENREQVYSRILTDKEFAWLYILSPKNRILAETPVIIGISEGNGPNMATINMDDKRDLSASEKIDQYTTPASFSVLTKKHADEYGPFAWRIHTEGAEAKQNIMMHGPINMQSPEYVQKQLRAFLSTNPQDRHMSNGCLRIPEKFLKDHAKDFFEGMRIDIAPNSEKGKEVFMDPGTAEMDTIGSESWKHNIYAHLIAYLDKKLKK